MPEPKEGSIEQAVSRLLTEPQQANPEVEPEEVQEGETPEAEVEEEPEMQEAAELESDTEAESEEETSDEEESEEREELYLVRIDGEDYEVSLEELQSGYQRQKDYTKKTQEISEARKAAEAQQAELIATQEDFIQKAQMADQLLNRDLNKYKSVDWEALKQEDPVGYVQKQIEIGELNQARQQLRDQAQQVFESNQKAQREEQAKMLEAERKEMLKLFPDWRDSDKATSQQSNIINYARELGYVDTELAMITRAKDLLVLDKARKYDEMIKDTGEITTKKKPAMRKVIKSKGVAPKSAPAKKKTAEARDKLRNSGSLKDAAYFLAQRREGNVINK